MSWLAKIKSRSISVLPIQAGGCRGCLLQFFLSLSLYSEIKGITVTGNPGQADLLLITGCINEQSKKAILEIYEKIPEPKAVISIGACSCSGSLFKKEGKGIYAAEDILPVDAWVRGCTPNPEEIPGTIVRAVECAYEKVK
ncbi:MAG: Ni,Fe-hydrogenase III small subunit [Clostridiaceae bacterium]|jgi:Ni,Fe-hydrogenase III small subunit|nr:Ni,Fe-hydrogenase III small subunit [Clostridiaceae bacterium]